MSKAHPILFSTPMVQAILAGEKTQTRRIVKLKGKWDHVKNKKFGLTAFTPESNISMRGTFPSGRFGEVFIKCPYGQVGDHLWVRETFYSYGIWIQEDNGKHRFIHHQDPVFKYMDNPPVEVLIKSGKDDGLAFYKRPSIFMPREASRITLEITDIRVERLHDITQNDAADEGAELVYGSYRTGFALIWENVNGKGSWDNMNPWVWVVSFKKIKP